MFSTVENYWASTEMLNLSTPPRYMPRVNPTCNCVDNKRP